MKYRLYGMDGIQKHEKKMLIDWKVLKPKESTTIRKVKKRKQVGRRDENGDTEYYSTDVSGSRDSCYSLKRK